ncbi:MAG: fimbrial protein [Collimonas pratensis]|uniref:fimbrial protein n=1 Tax=Collimonas pratensis TaxID=279113 RepID=UPI003C707AB7
MNYLNYSPPVFKLKKLYLVSLLCIMSVYAAPAQAACTFSTGFGSGDAATVSFGNIVVQRDVAPGAILATATSTAFGNRGNFIGCDGIRITSRWSTAGLSPVTYNGEQLFNVGIAGVAMRVVTPYTYGAYGSGPFPRDIITNGCVGTGAYSTFCGGMWGHPTFQLVKTGNTASGTTNIPGSIQASLVNLTYVYTFRFAASTLTTVACSVSNTVVPVPLGEVDLSKFTGTGSTPGAQNFNISLNCDAGTKVNITLDGTHDSSGIAGVLALSPSAGTVAQGAGVQLLHGGTPVALGVPIATGTAAAAGNYNIPLVARYYQTAATVMPGVANSAATFTITYN